MKKELNKPTIIIIILLVIFGALIFIGVNTFNNRNIKYTEKYISDVNNYSTYFAIQGQVQSFLNMPHEQKEFVTDDKSISLKDLPQYNDVQFKADSIKFVNTKTNTIYLVHGEIYEAIFDDFKLINNDFNIIMIADYSNETLLFCEYNNDYLSVITDNQNLIIEKNEYNGIESSKIYSDYDVCSIYYYDYINLILYNNIDEAYSKIGKKYRKGVAGDYNIFKNYVTQSNNKLTTPINECYKKNNVFTVYNTDGIKYTFFEKSIMNYEISLD